MIVVRALTRLKFDFNGYHFDIKPDEKLLFARDIFELLPEELKRCFERANSAIPPFYDGERLDGKTLFVFMQGAIGDVLCATVALREIKRRYPTCRLWVSVSGRARPVLENLPYIDRLLPHPAPIREVVKANYFVKAVEMVNTPGFDHMNMVKWFLWKFRLYFAEDETPDVYVDPQIYEELRPYFEEVKRLSGKKKILLFHYLASSIHRTIPPKLLKEIEENLWKDDYVPVICSLPEEDVSVEVALDVYGIKAGNLSYLMKDIRYLIAGVALSDAVITTDTATLHIAGGLKKPTVFISGPIEAGLRANTYPTVIPVRARYKGQTCKAPCGIHALSEPCHEAKLKNSFYSPCLESIPPEVIYLALKDAELTVEKDFPVPKSCPLCQYSGSFYLFEVINQHRIFQCPSCELQFAYPLKAMDYNSAYQLEFKGLLKYGEIAYESYQRHFDRKKCRDEWKRIPRYNVLLPILSCLPKGKLLDVGCSAGHFLLIAEEKGFEVYGMEASERAVEIARKRFGLPVVKALSFDELPEDFRGPYRVITAFEVLEHLEEPLSFLKGAYDLLEEGGFLIVSVPPYFKMENLAFGYARYKWWYNDYPPHHLLRFRPWTLFYALKLACFEEVVIFTEPCLSGTLLEGVNERPITFFVDSGKQIHLSREMVGFILMESFKPLYTNARILGNFLYGIGVKGRSGIPWEKVVSDAIAISAVDIMWRDDHL